MATDDHSSFVAIQHLADWIGGYMPEVSDGDRGWLSPKLAQTLVGVVMALAGFFANSLYNKVEDVADQFAAYQTTVAEKYVTKTELSATQRDTIRSIDQILDSQKRMNEKIDRIADKIGIINQYPYSAPAR